MKQGTVAESTMPQTAHSYGRISFAYRQEKGTGLLRQQGRLDEADESWPEKVCKQQGWRLSEEKYTDKGSGFHKRNLRPRAALTRFIKMIDDGLVLPGHVLLLDKLDRLSRAEVDQAYDLFRDILRKGVWICTREPFRVYRADREQGFMDIMEPLWIMYTNWLESKKKQDNSQAAWKYQRGQARDKRRPHQSKPPWWLVKDKAGKGATCYRPNGERFALARRMHELRWQGLGSGKIMAKLVAEGVPSPTRSGKWNVRIIEDCLRGKAIYGEYQPRATVDGKQFTLNLVRGLDDCLTSS